MMSGAASQRPDTTDRQQATRFKPGQSGNPKGRPKGSRNKFGERFFEEFLEHFEKHGKEAIEKVYADSPKEYLKIAATLVPKQLDIDDAWKRADPAELSDEELIAIINDERGRT